MRILITGARGQLGTALQRCAGSHTVVALDRASCDVTDVAVAGAIADHHPQLVINAAAMTDVDGCEMQPEAAYRVNGLGARNVALGAARCGAELVQVSTEYVFDGTKGQAYWEFDRPAPISVYGASKLAGEELAFAVHARTYIARTSWLYGLGGEHFVNKILTLTRDRPELSVVDNEVGSPTFCDDLAAAILALAATGAYGIYHLANEGACSRYEFAQAILDIAGRPDYPVQPTHYYRRLARPPAFAPLRNFAAAELGVRLPPWRDALERYLAQVGAADA